MAGQGRLPESHQLAPVPALDDVGQHQHAITLVGAIIIAAMFEAGGALIAGGDVVSTISKGIGVQGSADAKKGKTIGVWFFGNEYPFLSWMSQLGIPILSDEIYDGLTYDDEARLRETLPGVKRTVRPGASNRDRLRPELFVRVQARCRISTVGGRILVVIAIMRFQCCDTSRLHRIRPLGDEQLLFACVFCLEFRV